MTIANKTKKLSTIIAVGDIHGEFGALGYCIRERYKIQDSIICLCGDIGMGFHSRNYYYVELGKLDKIAKAKNNIIIAVRGNHDDPSYFNEEFCEQAKFTNIVLVPDYTVIESADKRILFIGGGTSIDRRHRTLGETYWKNEAPVYNEELLIAAGRPDVIITHSAPSFCDPLTKYGIRSWLALDSSLEEDTRKERQVFDNVFHKLLMLYDDAPSFWLYGHFHMSISKEFECTKFKCVNELEFFTI